MDIYDSRYFVINKTLLASFGLWPYQHPAKKFFIRTFLVVFIFISSLPQLYGLRKNFGVHMDKIIEHLALLMYIYGIKLKVVTTILSEEKLKAVYENIAENWEALTDENERSILTKYSERGRLLTIGYITYMTMALAFFITLPLAPLLLNVAMPLANGSRPRDYILHGEFPLAELEEHYAEIYLFDSLACIATVCVFCAVDSCYATCVEHCIGLFSIVKHERMPISCMC